MPGALQFQSSSQHAMQIGGTFCFQEEFDRERTPPSGAHCRVCYCAAEDSKKSHKHVGCEDRNENNSGSGRANVAPM
ncbi:hypothetical protein OUZ56_031216 [Daphnia magna]|uniref:Uncharacterized protein n=1 Tax=Daphnia magna TaxID=35525 RepID=A0ABQ9ZTL5_9CRUS|nr:hypothetical protein OUZ56_031216 [Daphnia magna]